MTDNTAARLAQQRLSDHYATTDPRPAPQTVQEQVAALEKAGDAISPTMRTALGYAQGEVARDNAAKQAERKNQEQE